MKTHVVMLHGPEVAVPSTLSSLVDVSIDLADMPARYLELAIVRSFELDEPKIWLGPDVNRLKPSLFDAACARAPDWTEVAPILNRLARAELDEEAIAAKAKEKDKKKPSTSTSKTAFVPEVLHPTEPTLDMLSGDGAFAEWAKDAARDIADYRAGRLAWSDVDVGCLLHGPPGTGKTFAARAFAATCGLPFMPVSFAQWTASGRSYQGDVIAAMRATFAAATALSPCVLFIDEFDSIPSREGTKEYRDYWIPIVNAKLELLDGTAGRPGVIVIAACNDPSRLDPAMVRSGRLDRHFRLSLPDEPSLLGMLGYHLPGADLQALAPAATILAGSASAADVARFAREARRAARRQNREVTAEDLLSIAMPVDTMSPRDRRLVAVHEAGHAVVAMAFGRIPGALSIVSADGAHGGVRLGSDIGMGRLSDFEAEAIISLAGRAAEEAILGEPSAGAEVDLRSATALVLQLIGTTGLGGRLTHGERVDAAAVEGRLRDLYSRAVRLVGEHRKAVEALADLAIERRVLGRAALVEFAREHGFGGSR
ncbi:AAA family ATPase [uncultured Aureimonas sp.]|uniref:AAA family ATPase n=1 Tax=uncultured Aureimonas sp. TaxID=1604662 RepID=UPI0025E4C748|nr:AAA family ATPase [uncultured Aureimonas sp.]